jgi:hypothetical protein
VPLKKGIGVKERVTLWITLIIIGFCEVFERTETSGSLVLKIFK